MTLAAALLGAAMISFSAIFFRLSGVDALTGGLFRALYALPVLFLVWRIRREDDRRGARKRWLAFVAGLALGLDIFTWHISIGYIGAGLATLIANTQVVFVAIAAWILLGERPSRVAFAAIPIVLVGVALVSGLGQGDPFGSHPVQGTLLALVAAAFYAMFILGYRQSSMGGAPAAGPLMEATAGAVVSISLIGLVGPGLSFGFEWPAHGWLLALALGPQVLAWLLIGYALPRLPAVETATIVLIQPALTMVWAAIIFGESPSALQILGAAIVLAGVGMVAFARGRRVVAPPL